jgi:hypothetical protein
MGKSSRQKRRTYQTPKKARAGANLVWYAAAAVVVIAGVLGVALSRSNSASGVGPQATDHWHAALGVNNCGKWDPNWLTPVSQTTQGAVRAGTDVYAGMHSHGDGLIHMEPQSSDEMGKHATLGTYFKFSGFKIDSTSMSFGTLDPATTVVVKNGDKCNGKPGVLRWSVNGKEKHGNPASYKIFNGDAIAVVFTTADAKMPKKTDIPSYSELQSRVGNPNAPENAPGATVPNNTATTTTAPGSTTVVPTTPTSTGATTTPTS